MLKGIFKKASVAIQSAAILLEWKHDPMSLTRCVADTHFHATGNAGVTLRLVETSDSFPHHAGCLRVGQTVEVGFFSCKEAFRCLNTSSSSFTSMTSLGTGCLELGCSFLWSCLPLLVD